MTQVDSHLALKNQCDKSGVQGVAIDKCCEQFIPEAGAEAMLVYLGDVSVRAMTKAMDRSPGTVSLVFQCVSVPVHKTLTNDQEKG